MPKIKQPTTRDNLRKKKVQNKPDNPVYKAYQKYLRSDVFKTLKQRMLERDNYTCCCCKRSIEEIADTKLTLQAHHRSYDNLGEGGDKELGDLITLCCVCHKAIHSAPSNFKRFTNKDNIMKPQEINT